MRRTALKQSELISSIGWKNSDMEVRYRDDGAIFLYHKVPYTTYAALTRSVNPGQEWLKIRDQYSYTRIE